MLSWTGRGFRVARLVASVWISRLVGLSTRRYALKNRERLNRLLMLLQLPVNGQDEVQGYTKTIRSRLEANGGRPTTHRRAIAYPAGVPSLR